MVPNTCWRIRDQGSTEHLHFLWILKWVEQVLCSVYLEHHILLDMMNDNWYYTRLLGLRNPSRDYKFCMIYSGVYKRDKLLILNGNHYHKKKHILELVVKVQIYNLNILFCYILHSLHQCIRHWEKSWNWLIYVPFFLANKLKWRIWYIS